MLAKFGNDKIIECTICRQVIMFGRREIRQIVSKHPIIEIHLEGSPICSYVEAINATGHLNSRAVLRYSDCLLKVTDDIVTMWLNTGKVTTNQIDQMLRFAKILVAWRE